MKFRWLAVGFVVVASLGAGIQLVPGSIDASQVATGILPLTRGGTGTANGSTGLTTGTWGSTEQTPVAAPETTNFSGAYRITSLGTQKFRNIACNWATAGSGGSTGVVVKIRNITAGSDLCSCTLGACDTVALTPLACDCNTAPAASANYTIQLAAGTDCAANPALFYCNVEITQ